MGCTPRRVAALFQQQPRRLLPRPSIIRGFSSTTPISCLACNSGIAGPRSAACSISSTCPELWRRLFRLKALAGITRRTDNKDRREKTSMLRILLAAAAALLALASPVAAQTNAKGPQFAVDPFWPKPLPDKWILGQVAGIAVDSKDNVWIIHRPATLLDDEKGAQKNPPETRCCIARAGRAAILPRRQAAQELGRAGPGLRLAQDRARHSRRQGGQRLGRRQRQRRSPDPEIHARRQIPDADRQGRPLPAAPTARPSSAGRRTW